MVIYDEELKRFHDWLRAKGEHPSVVLTLKWISEFELYAEEDEEKFRQLKAWAKQRSEYDRDAAMTLKFITQFEETEDPDPMLKRFHDWLQLKVGDRTAALARWWLGEFKETQEEDSSEEEDSSDTGPSPTLH
jgi:hypothetical protein